MSQWFQAVLADGVDPLGASGSKGKLGGDDLDSDVQMTDNSRSMHGQRTWLISNCSCLL